jgi:hypothetical protein
LSSVDPDTEAAADYFAYADADAAAEGAPADRVLLDYSRRRVSALDTYYWGPARQSADDPRDPRSPRGRRGASSSGSSSSFGAGDSDESSDFLDSPAARLSRHTSRQRLTAAVSMLSARARAPPSPTPAAAGAAPTAVALPPGALPVHTLTGLCVEADDPLLSVLLERAITDALRHGETGPALSLFDEMRFDYHLPPSPALYAAVMTFLWRAMVTAAERPDRTGAGTAHGASTYAGVIAAGLPYSHARQMRPPPVSHGSDGWLPEPLLQLASVRADGRLDFWALLGLPAPPSPAYRSRRSSQGGFASGGGDDYDTDEVVAAATAHAAAVPLASTLGPIVALAAALKAAPDTPPAVPVAPPLSGYFSPSPFAAALTSGAAARATATVGDPSHAAAAAAAADAALAARALPADAAAAFGALQPVTPLWLPSEPLPLGADEPALALLAAWRPVLAAQLLAAPGAEHALDYLTALAGWAAHCDHTAAAAAGTGASTDAGTAAIVSASALTTWGSVQPPTPEDVAALDASIPGLALLLPQDPACRASPGVHAAHEGSAIANTALPLCPPVFVPDDAVSLFGLLAEAQSLGRDADAAIYTPVLRLCAEHRWLCTAQALLAAMAVPRCVVTPPVPLRARAAAASVPTESELAERLLLLMEPGAEPQQALYGDADASALASAATLHAVRPLTPEEAAAAATAVGEAAGSATASAAVAADSRAPLVPAHAPASDITAAAAAATATAAAAAAAHTTASAGVGYADGGDGDDGNPFADDEPPVVSDVMSEAVARFAASEDARHGIHAPDAAAAAAAAVGALANAADADAAPAAAVVPLVSRARLPLRAQWALLSQHGFTAEVVTLAPLAYHINSLFAAFPRALAAPQFEDGSSTAATAKAAARAFAASSAHRKYADYLVNVLETAFARSPPGAALLAAANPGADTAALDAAVPTAAAAAIAAGVAARDGPGGLTSLLTAGLLTLPSEAAVLQASQLRELGGAAPLLPAAGAEDGADADADTARVLAKFTGAQRAKLESLRRIRDRDARFAAVTDAELVRGLAGDVNANASSASGVSAGAAATTTPAGVSALAADLLGLSGAAGSPAGTSRISEGGMLVSLSRCAPAANFYASHAGAPEPTAVAYDLALEELLRIGADDAFVLLVYRQVARNRPGAQASEANVAEAIARCRALGDPIAALALLTVMRRAGCEPTLATYSQALSAVAEAAAPARGGPTAWTQRSVLRLLSCLESARAVGHEGPDAAAYNQAIPALLHWRTAIGLLGRMRRARVTPNSLTLTLVLAACTRSGAPADVTARVETAVRAAVADHAQTLQSAEQKLLRETTAAGRLDGPLSEAVERDLADLRISLGAKSAVTDNSLFESQLHTAATAGDLEAALGLVNNAFAQGARISAGTFPLLMQAVAARGAGASLGDAHRVLRAALAANLASDVRLWSVYLTVCENTGHEHAALGAFLFLCQAGGLPCWVPVVGNPLFDAQAWRAPLRPLLATAQPMKAVWRLANQGALPAELAVPPLKGHAAVGAFHPALLGPASLLASASAAGEMLLPSPHLSGPLQATLRLALREWQDLQLMYWQADAANAGVAVTNSTWSPAAAMRSHTNRLWLVRSEGGAGPLRPRPGRTLHRSAALPIKLPAPDRRLMHSGLRLLNALPMPDAAAQCLEYMAALASKSAATAAAPTHAPTPAEATAGRWGAQADSEASAAAAAAANETTLQFYAQSLPASHDGVQQYLSLRARGLAPPVFDAQAGTGSAAARHGKASQGAGAGIRAHGGAGAATVAGKARLAEDMAAARVPVPRVDVSGMPVQAAALKVRTALFLLYSDGCFDGSDGLGGRRRGALPEQVTLQCGTAHAPDLVLQEGVCWALQSFIPGLKPSKTGALVLTKKQLQDGYGEFVRVRRTDAKSVGNSLKHISAVLNDDTAFLDSCSARANGEAPASAAAAGVIAAADYESVTAAVSAWTPSQCASLRRTLVAARTLTHRAVEAAQALENFYSKARQRGAGPRAREQAASGSFPAWALPPAPLALVLPSTIADYFATQAVSHAAAAATPADEQMARLGAMLAPELVASAVIDVALTDSSSVAQLAGGASDAAADSGAAATSVAAGSARTQSAPSPSASARASAPASSPVSTSTPTPPPVKAPAPAAPLAPAPAPAATSAPAKAKLLPRMRLPVQGLARLPGAQTGVGGGSAAANSWFQTDAKPYSTQAAPISPETEVAPLFTRIDFARAAESAAAFEDALAAVRGDIAALLDGAAAPRQRDGGAGGMYQPFVVVDAARTRALEEKLAQASAERRARTLKARTAHSGAKAASA